jgi:hypothetical protein
LTHLKDIDGQPLCPEAERMMEYLRTRPAELDAAGVRERVRAATVELEKIVGEVPEPDTRLRPVAGKWNIAEVVDHIAQTQIRAAEELRHLFAGRRPPGPPVYEALRTGAPGEAEKSGVLVRTILVVNYPLPEGGSGTQIFPADIDWKQYALLQRLHLLDHRTQIKKLRVALGAAAAAS